MLTLAKEMNIKKALNIIKEIRSVVGNWDRYATEMGVDRNLMQSIRDTFPRIE